MTRNDIQLHFAELLRKLTDSGKLEWAQSKHDVGFVQCWTGEDLIVFEVRGGEKAVHISPSEEVAGMTSNCRNVIYLWLPVTPGWDILVKLLRQAPVDDTRFTQLTRKASDTPIHVLEMRDKNERD